MNNSHWVVQIHNERPITPSYTREIIKELQYPNTARQISITLCKMRDAVRCNFQNYRAVFDSCISPAYGHMSTISGPSNDLLTCNQMTVLSEPPELPTSLNKALQGEHKMDWMVSAFEVFNKNQKSQSLLNTLSYRRPTTRKESATSSLGSKNGKSCTQHI